MTVLEYVDANLTTNAIYEYDEIIDEIVNVEKNRICGGSIIHEHFILTSARCCSDILNSENGEAKILLGLDLVITACFCYLSKLPACGQPQKQFLWRLELI
jgi:hypothetical protein